MKPEYSIVIPCYNKIALTKICVKSVIQMSAKYDYELIVVANGCHDGTEDWILNQIMDPHIVLVSYNEPIGGGEAINVGFRLANGEYIATINNDTRILGPEWLSLLRKPFDLDPRMAVTGPLEQGFPEIGSSFLVFFCAMTRRKILDTLGYLDTDTFKTGGCEDADFCERAKRAGLHIQQVPQEQYKVVGELNIGNFPIYHQGEGTVHDATLVQNWKSILAGNRKILVDRYLK